jgi:hypothetical protein
MVVMAEGPEMDDHDRTAAAFRAAAQAGGDLARLVGSRADYTTSTSPSAAMAPAYSENVHLELPFGGLPAGTNLAAIGRAN